jgi:hypothetical protein
MNMLMEGARIAVRTAEHAQRGGTLSYSGQAPQRAESHGDVRGNSPAKNVPPVDGAAALDEARAFLAAFWCPPAEAALDVMALYAAHTHVRDQDGTLASWSTPKLAFVSNEAGSGKTAGMELTGLLSSGFRLVTDPTAPALLEMIAQMPGLTLGIDEVDLLFGSGMGAKAVRNVINSGYRKGASIPRVKGPQDCFAPMMLAGLASSYMGNATLAPTRSRSIIIHCRKPGPGMKPQRYREQLHAPLGRLHAEALADWAQQNVTGIITAWPEMPELDGRTEDVWMPLFAVAQVAGGSWPDRVRAACLEFTRGETDGTPVLPPRMRLLADIRACWPDDADEMTAAELGTALANVPGAPWAAMWSPVAMVRELPGLLGIQPVRIGTTQGYRRSDVEELSEGR